MPCVAPTDPYASPKLAIITALHPLFFNSRIVVPMKFFLLKKPMGLAFVPQEYTEGESVQPCDQIRMSGGKSNARVVKCTDGHWYLRVGATMRRLKPVPARDTTVISLDEKGGQFVGTIDRKWFVEKK